MSEKVYVGVRLTDGRSEVYIERKGVQRKLKHVVRHSPDGLSWGYNGSGPADCARSILADCVGLPYANDLYQRFKFEVVGLLPGQPEKGKSGECWRLTEEQVKQWVDRPYNREAIALRAQVREMVG